MKNYCALASSAAHWARLSAIASAFGSNAEASFFLSQGNGKNTSGLNAVPGFGCVQFESQM